MFVFLSLLLIWTSSSASSISMALASEAFLASEAVSAQQVSKSVALSPSAAFWKNTPAKEFLIYPQKTVRLNDRTVNQELDKLPPENISEKIQVKIVYNDREIGIWLEWKDATETQLNQEETNSFADAVAIEFPKQFGKNLRLPYVGMGDEQAPVQVAMQRVLKKQAQKNEYVSEGFGSLTKIPSGQSQMNLKMNMVYDSTAKVWRAVFIRSLLKQNLIPIAFAFWDGARAERGGNKYLSGWKFLQLSKYKMDLDYLKELSFGFDPKDRDIQENIRKGKEIFMSSCIACHRIDSKTDDKLAPNLSNIGGIASSSYLRDSIVEPSLVVVKNPQASNEVYQWYTRDSSGKKISKMPKFGFSPEVVSNIVAYLKSLDGGK